MMRLKLDWVIQKSKLCCKLSAIEFYLRSQIQPLIANLYHQNLWKLPKSNSPVEFASFEDLSAKPDFKRCLRRAAPTHSS